MTDIPTLLPYQARWVEDESSLAVIEKSRRIGMSWTEAYGAVMHAAEDRGDVYYQSYSHDMARGFISDAAEWAESLNLVFESLGEVLIDIEDAKAVQAFRIVLANGRTINALASSPRAWRSKGRPGDLAIIDEAAFCDDLAEVLKAVMATLVWGGRVRIISTHNGEANPFAALVRDIRDGKQPGSLHTVAFKGALAEGLYKRICVITGRRWTEEGERQWEAAIRAQYGSAAEQELDCVPSAGTGAWLHWALIRAAEHHLAGDPEQRQGTQFYLGVDIARRRDLWVAAVIEVVGDVRWLRELRVERNIPFSQQHDIVAELVAKYRPIRVAIDQTGMGEEFVETEQGKHGEIRVEGVILSSPKRLDVATALRECFEDHRMRITDDEELRRDLHSMRAETGPTGGPRLFADGDTDGHADRFWAIALAVAAAAGGAVKIAYEPVTESGYNGAEADPSLDDGDNNLPGDPWGMTNRPIRRIWSHKTVWGA